MENEIQMAYDNYMIAIGYQADAETAACLAEGQAHAATCRDMAVSARKSADTAYEKWATLRGLLG